jgi:hypothetical protein
MSGGNFVKEKKVAWGDYFQLLQTPFGSAVAKENCPNAPFQFGGTVDAAKAPYWSLPSWRRYENKCDALMMHHANYKNR